MLNLESTTEHIVQDFFSEHPFLQIPSTVDFKKLMAEYLAMSIAFPYLQAGSQGEVFFYYMEKNLAAPKDVELTTVVGNFLCWDETGGFGATLLRGLKGLPRILETQNFHANILKKDCEFLFSQPIEPSYSEITKNYLMDLYKGLSSLCKITRLAMMVSFETHANNMIQCLWGSLFKKFSIEKSSLRYFQLHVGGDDPAEKYHVDMTNNLIEKIAGNDQEEFYEKFKLNYALHYNWCNNIIKISM